MPNHKDVLGNEIHPTRVDLITQGRSPRFAGEVVFDVAAETLIVSTSLAPDSWRRGVPAPPPIPTPPIAFHWSLNLAITNSLAFNRLSLFYAPPNANVNASSSFSLLRRFVAGVDIARGTVLDLTPWIAAKGTGFYMPLLIVPDAYGGNDAGLAPQVRLTWSNPPSASGNQNSAASVTSVTTFTDDQGRSYSGCNALRCLNPFAHVNAEIFQ